MKKTFFISTAIDYPTSKPHLGHAYEKISTDVIARFKRMQGWSVHFSTGTDEHGIKIQRAAEKANKPVKEFVDEMVKSFHLLCKVLNISYDDFIRTTEKRHEKTVLEIFKKVQKRGDIYKGTYEGLYCVGCETFYTQSELDKGLCPVHKRKPEFVREDSYFFKMGKYRNRIIKNINKKFIIPDEKKHEIINRLKELHDLSISRTTFHWGIPVPGDRRHVLYVWMDALVNYLTTLEYPKIKYRKFWPGIHIIGKDILWHHSVIWPAILFSTGLSAPKHILVHGFVNSGGEKLSKSRGNIIDPVKLAEKYPADYLRFFLSVIAFGEDGEFSEAAMAERINNELIANYGNLFYRVTHFIEKNFASVPHGREGKEEKALIRKLQKTIRTVKRHVNDFRTDLALKDIMELSGEVNKYFQKNEPWKTGKKRAADVLYTSVNILKAITILLYPYIPESSEKALKSLNAKLKWNHVNKFTLKPGHKIKAEILFRKIEQDDVNLPQKKEERFVKLDDFKKNDLRVGTITNVKDHPDADKLYILDVDIGNEKRQLVAGLKHYAKDELKNKQVVVIVNIETAVIRGVKSNGMILASDDGTIITPIKNVKNGSKII